MSTLQPVVAPERRTRHVQMLDLALTHPLLSVFVLALALRVATAIIIWAFHGGSIYEDDAIYVVMARQRAHGQDGTWDEYTRWLFDHTRTFLLPLSWLYRFTSGSLPGQLFVAVLGAGAAVLATVLVSRAASRRVALGAGLIVAVLPSQVILSSVALKDAPVWVLLLGLSVLVARPPERSRGATATTVLVITGLLVLLAHVRLHTFVTTCIALTIVTVLLVREHRPARTLGVLGAAMLVPLFLGLGPFGMAFVTDNAGSIDSIRASNARGEAAIGAAQTTTTALPSPTTTSAPPQRPTTSTTAPPTAVDAGGTSGADLSYLPHGVFALLFEPVPWRGGGGIERRLATLETVVWYPLLLLAVVGASASWRRRRTLAFPVVVGTGTLLMWGLIEGNIGTAYRHRGEFAWAVCCLAALGAERMWRWRAVKR